MQGHTIFISEYFVFLLKSFAQFGMQVTKNGLKKGDPFILSSLLSSCVTLRHLVSPSVTTLSMCINSMKKKTPRDSPIKVHHATKSQHKLDISTRINTRSLCNVHAVQCVQSRDENSESKKVDASLKTIINDSKCIVYNITFFPKTIKMKPNKWTILLSIKSNLVLYAAQGFPKCPKYEKNAQLRHHIFRKGYNTLGYLKKVK